jgi:hypothetical protein
MKKRVILLAALMLFFSPVPLSRCAEYGLEAELERDKVSPGNPIYLHLTFHGSQNAPRPDFNGIDGIQIKYVGPSTKVSVVNGKVSKSISHNYLIIPKKEGTYELGPFKLDYNGRKYIAPSVELEVSGVPRGMPRQATARTTSYPSPPGPSGLSSTPFTDDRIFLDIDISKETLYLNEKVVLTITLYVDDLEVRDIEYPSFSHEGFTADEFEKPEKSSRYYRGKRYNVLIFRQMLTGVKEGEYELGPAGLKCEIISRSRASRRNSFFGFDDFFSSRFGGRSYPVELRSDPVDIRILPLPEEGKPASFRGAVGNFSLEMFPLKKKVKAGDPVVLRSIIRGYGNLSTVSAPVVNAGEQFKVYDPQVSVKGSSKIYEQIFIPLSDEVKEIPRAELSFFNPISERYETIEKGPFPVEVEPVPEDERRVKMVGGSVNGGIYYPEEELGEDVIHIKQDEGELNRRGKFVFEYPYFWIAQIIPLIFFLTSLSAHSRRVRLMTDEAFARRHKAPGQARKGLRESAAALSRGNEKEFYDTIFRTLSEYLSDRLYIPRGDVSVRTVNEKISVSPEGKELADKISDIFNECDMARYGATASVKPRKILSDVKKIIKFMEKHRV